jgi:NitT/TauT family transport system substrate-binding protein
MWLSACAEPPAAPLRLGTNVWPGYEPLYLARELGYLDPRSVKLVEYLSTSEVLRAFRNGTLEAAALTLDEVLLLAQDDILIRIILVNDISAGADAILARPGIASIEELAGRRIGVENTAVGAYFLSRALEKHGVALKDVTTLPLEVHEQETAFQEARVDAVVSFEPVRTRLLAAGAKELFSSRELPDEIIDVIAVRDDYLVTHPKQAKQLVGAWFKALDYLASNPTDAAARMSQRLRLNGAQVLASYSGLKLADRTANVRLLGGTVPPVLAAARRLEAMLRAQRLLRAPVAIDALVAPLALEVIQTR